MTERLIRRALISVSDKSGLIYFARALAGYGVEIISTGGTAKALRDAGIAVTDVSTATGFPEIMDGRVKTLHPKIHGGLLALRDKPDHAEAMRAHGIEGIDLLVCNLYPFESVAAASSSFAETLENIDIGGPAMIRAAAKNHEWVTVVVDAEDYTTLLSELAATGGKTHAETRRKLAQTAYARTAAYDSAVSNWLTGELTKSGVAERKSPSAGAILRFERETPWRRHGRTASGQGAVVQQHRRHRCGVRIGGGVRFEAAGLRHHQARQSVRRGDLIEARRRLQRGARLRSR